MASSRPITAALYGPGETLTYASQRLLTTHSLAREFPRSMISKTPFANETAPPGDAFKRHQAAGFSDWRLVVDGMVAHPASLSLADLKHFPPQPDHRGGLRRRLVLRRGVDRNTAHRSARTRPASCRRRAMSSTSPSSLTGGRASTWPTRSTLRPFSPGA